MGWWRWLGWEQFSSVVAVIPFIALAVWERSFPPRSVWLPADGIRGLVLLDCIHLSSLPC